MLTVNGTSGSKGVQVSCSECAKDSCNSIIDIALSIAYVLAFSFKLPKSLQNSSSLSVL